MTKEELIEILREIEFHHRSLRRIHRDTNCLFCFGIIDQIHIDSSRFNEVVSILQPTVTYNPNWSKRYPNTTEAYFFMELNDHKYKLFALLPKEVK